MRAVAFGLALLAGCSFVFVDTLPRDYDGTTPPRCTTSMTAVYVDHLAVTLDLVTAVLLLKYQRDHGVDVWPYAVGNAADGALHAIGALHGEYQVKRCRRAVTAWDARATGPTPAQPPPAGDFCYRNAAHDERCFPTMAACRDHWIEHADFNARRCKRR